LNCGSRKIGVLDESEEEVKEICEKRGKHLSSKEKEVEDHALETAELVNAYGRLSAIVLAGKNLRIPDVKAILASETQMSDQLFELITDAERNALTKRFW